LPISISVKPIEPTLFAFDIVAFSKDSYRKDDLTKFYGTDVKALAVYQLK
jgi:hypothetical protein